MRLALSRITAGLTYVEGEIAQALAALPIEQRQQLSERDLEILRLLGEGRSFAKLLVNDECFLDKISLTDAPEVLRPPARLQQHFLT